MKKLMNLNFVQSKYFIKFIIINLLNALNYIPMLSHLVIVRAPKTRKPNHFFYLFEELRIKITPVDIKSKSKQNY